MPRSKPTALYFSINISDQAPSMSYYEYNVSSNGFEVIAEYSDHTVNKLIIPLIKSLNKLEPKGKRTIIFLAAPPGAGKTTLSKVIEQLSEELSNQKKIIAAGLDGFHFKSDYLKNNHVLFEGERILLNSIKGSPLSFNIGHFIKKLEESTTNEECLWPTYDRNIHDIIEDNLKIDSTILLVEGNWLLLNDEAWSIARKYCDLSIFIDACPNLLKTRLIDRKCRGGLSRPEAEQFYEKSDIKNVLNVLNNSVRPDICLKFKDDGRELICKSGCDILN